MPAATEATREAGDFSAWLHQTRRALRQDVDTQVGCGDCIGCCSAGYFVQVRPDEAQALARIPPAVRVPAPGKPGHQLLGYDARGHCPMLHAGRCSIYAHRPRTCRTYDCRVFTAAGIAAGDAAKSIINERVRNWRFSYPTPQDHFEQAAVQRVAHFIRHNAHSFPGGRFAASPTQVAILAIKTYEVMLDSDEPDEDSPASASIALQIIAACRRFDTGPPAR